MRYRALLLGLALAIGAAVTACGDEGDGRVELVFAWDEQPANAVWIWARVEARPNGVDRGTILASVGPARYTPGGDLQLDLPQLERGADRVVIVEVRAENDEGLQVTHYGISPPFATRPGRRTVVEVPVKLQLPASQQTPPRIALRFDQQQRDFVDATEISAATVVTRSIGAETLLIANDGSFSAGLFRTPLTTGDGVSCDDIMDGGALWRECTLSGWDLTNGLPSDLGDGLYTVHARFLDANGYASEIQRASVFLDSQPPQVLSTGLEPSIVPSGTRVVVTTTLVEALADGAWVNTLTATRSDDASKVLGEPERVPNSFSYRWTLDTADASHDDTYTFVAHLVDGVGNASPTPFTLLGDDGSPLTLLIDDVAPTLDDPTGVTLSTTSLNLAFSPLFFEARLIEAHPVDATATFPEVLVDGRGTGRGFALATLDDPSTDRWGFLFEVYINPDLWPGVQNTVQLAVRWVDAAGNVSTSPIDVPGGLRFDFVPPEAVACTLSPDHAGLGTTVTLNVVAAELLGAAPTLTVAGAPTDLMGAGAATDAGFNWRWQQPAASLPEGPLAIDVALTDVAGNPSDGVACTVTADIDTTLPALTAPTIETLPTTRDTTGTILPSLRNGSTLRVAFTLTDAGGVAPGYPQVFLDAPQPLALKLESRTQLSPGVSRFVFTETFDAVAHASLEGTRSIRVVAVDRAGNTLDEPELDGAQVRVDFTPPVIVGNPFFERLPESPRARLLGNDLWVAADTDLSLSFAVSEPLLGPPRIVAESGASFVAERWDASTTFFTISARRLAADGVLTVQAEVSDRAGNAVALPIGTLRYDSVAAPAPSGDDLYAIQLLRAPWGSEETDWQRGTLLRSCPAPEGEDWPWCVADAPAPLEPDALIRVHRAIAGPDGVTCDGQVIGSGESDAAGGVAIAITGDLDAACITQVDRSGNAAALTPIDHVEWVANLGGKVRGDTTLNPHSITLGLDLVAAADQGARVAPVTQDAITTLGRTDGVWFDQGGFSRRYWTERTASEARYGPRNFAGMAYDTARDRVIMFGGNANTQPLSDTFEWDGRTWSERSPTTRPSPQSAHHKLVFDGARGRALLFDLMGSTWEWDGDDWSQLTPTSGPSPRVGHTLVWDAARSRVVMFGGAFSDQQGTLVALDDTWEWDGETWREVDVASPPPARQGAVLAYDPDRGRAVLFGGFDGAEYLADTWEFDGRAWREIASTGDGGAPPARVAHTMMWDGNRQRVMLFGGSRYRGQVELFDDLWAWDGAAWLRITPFGPRPTARAGAGGVWHHARSQVIVSGGSTRLGEVDDLWTWDGLRWQALDTTSETPPGSLLGAMAYDERRARTVHFGGLVLQTGEIMDDTWEWDGITWRQRHPSGGVAPAARNGFGMAYDALREEVFIVGGDTGADVLSDLWSYDGQRWRQHDVTDGAGLEPITQHAVVFDPGAGVLVAASGQSANDQGQRFDSQRVFRGSPNGWSRELTPFMLRGYGATWDRARDRMVLYGGVNIDGGSAALWEWTRTQGWTVRTPPGQTPGVRADAQLIYDRQVQRSLLFGGNIAIANTNDLWEWDGSQWSELKVLGAVPSARQLFGMVYDVARDVVVVFGGFSDAEQARDTWELSGRAGRLPATILTVDSSGAIPGAARLSAMAVEAIAGGVGWDDGAVQGVAVLGWDGPSGRWTELARDAEQGVEGARPLRWTSLRAADVARLVSTRDGLTRVAVVPPTASGLQGATRVDLDYLEVRLSYRWSRVGDDASCTDSSECSDGSCEFGVCCTPGERCCAADSDCADLAVADYCLDAGPAGCRGQGIDAICSLGRCREVVRPAAGACEDFACGSATCEGLMFSDAARCDAAGACVPGIPTSCDDATPATQDSCDPERGCANVDCATCDDLDPCTTDTCVPNVGCVYAPALGAPCDDDDACTTVAFCGDDGVCHAPNDDCTGDGPCVPNHKACDDGDPCTVDLCDPVTAGCGSAPADCDDGSACTQDSCDPVRGCVHTPGPDCCGALGSSCPSGFICSADGFCASADEVFVPAGRSAIGCEGPNCIIGSSAVEVDIAAFAIDRREVTAQEYTLCVTSGACLPAGLNAAGTFQVSGREQHPINVVLYANAAAFCAIGGKRLCSEAEWEKAARGGCSLHDPSACTTSTPLYPWGNKAPTCERTHYGGDGDGAGCGQGATAPVGSYPFGVSPYGALDMAGNVFEWVQDGFHNSHVGRPTDGSARPLTPDGTRVIKGGSYASDATLQQSVLRIQLDPSFVTAELGFRCCRSLAP